MFVGVIQERMKCMNILYTKCTDPDEIFHQILNILAAVSLSHIKYINSKILKNF